MRIAIESGLTGHGDRNDMTSPRVCRWNRIKAGEVTVRSLCTCLCKGPNELAQCLHVAHVGVQQVCLMGDAVSSCPFGS